MDIGKKLLLLRKEKNWTQSELAEKINARQRFISEWELGKTVPSPESLIKLSQVFGVSIDYLLLDNVPREGVAAINDFELYEYFRKTESLPKEAKDMIKQFLDALVLKYKLHEMPEAGFPDRDKPDQKIPLRKVAGKR